MKKARLLALLVTLVMLLGIFAACAQPEEDAPPQQDQPQDQRQDPDTDPDDYNDNDVDTAAVGVVTTQSTITILSGSQAVGFIPFYTNDVPSSEMHRLIYDRLFMMCYDTMEPREDLSLAVEWNQADARTTYVTIRQGVYFHNGNPLTAYDVAFTLNYASQTPQGIGVLGMIEYVEQLDDWSVRVNTNMDFVPIIAHLGHVRAAIIDARHFQEVGTDAFNAHPIGSGAWMFENLVIGDRVELVRNDNYWGAPAHLERLIWRVVPEASVRLMEVSSGTADVAIALAPIDMAGAYADPNVRVERRLNVTANYIGFNVQRPHINNRLVRQAINYALDMETMVDVVFMGTHAPLHGPMAPPVWGFHSMPPFPHDIERARELLIEAGYNPTPGEPGGFSTTIWWNIPNAQREQTAEMIAFTLAGLNIDVEIVSMEWAAYLDGTERGEHDIFILGWSPGSIDADNALWPLFHSSSPPAAGNRTFWNNPDLDVLLERGRGALDPNERRAIYAEAQELIRYYAPWIFWAQGETLLAVNPNLEGLTLAPGGVHNWTTVWFS